MPKVKNVLVQRTFNYEGLYSALITWDCSVSGVPDIQGFNVYRSLDSKDFQLVGSNLGICQYLDENIPLLQGEEYYYKITFIDNNGIESSLDEADAITFTHQLSTTNGFNTRLVNTSLEQIRRLAWLFKHVGEPVWFIIRQYVGKKCHRCYDFNSHKATDPNCPVCFGTGIEGGYKAVEGLMIVSPSDMRYLRDNDGFIVNNTLVVYLPFYPFLTSNDFIIRKRTGQRYLFNSVNQTIIEGFVVMQTARITLAEKGSKIYKLEVDNG